MGNPLVTTCNLAGNPLHEEQLAIVEMVGSVYAVNTVIDEDRRIAFVNFGEVVGSTPRRWLSRGRIRRPCEQAYDLIITSAAGYPLDKTYCQTVKGMLTPLAVLAEGGGLLIVSACEEGIGSGEFVESQRRLAWKQHLLFRSQGLTGLNHRLMRLSVG